MARGRWLQKVSQFAGRVGDKVEGMSDSIVDQVTESISETLNDDNRVVIQAVKRLKETATTCHDAARETAEICEATQDKRQQMIDFSSEIQETLSNLRGQDASVLETIKELTDGSKIEAVTDIARGLDDIATKCVDKSILMIDSIEDAIDSLPDVVKSAIDRAADSPAPGEERQVDADLDGDGEPDHELLEGFNQSIADVKACMNALQHLNLVTAFKVGLDAFTQLTENAKRSRSMFDAIRDFAKDVAEIAGTSFEDMDIRFVKFIVSKSKDLLRCIRLSDVMRKLAQAAGELMKLLVGLFQAAAKRISTLWSALAFAKDCMSDCMAQVMEAKEFCIHARDQSTELVQKSRSILTKLDSVGKINRESVESVRQLADGGEVGEAIDLATNMDDLIIKCIKTASTMVNRVSEGFEKLPKILTADIDVTTKGKQDDDPENADVTTDIDDIESARKSVEEADIFSAVGEGVRGFKGVSDKALVAKDYLGQIEEFAASCASTIESFMNAWDLESATKKITEMCRMVSLGKIIQQFAQEIKRLVLAMIALMKSVLHKITHIDIASIKDDIGNKVENVVNSVQDKLNLDDVGDTVGNVMDSMKGKVKFWKK